MTLKYGRPERAGDGAAGLVIAFPGGNCSAGHSPNPLKPQARRRLEVRLHVYDRYAPHGRSRTFKIKEADFHELIAAAERLEAR